MSRVQVPSLTPRFSRLIPTVFNGELFSCRQYRIGRTPESLPTGCLREGYPWPGSQRAESALRISPDRLGLVQTAYAATVHRSQGSQFDTVFVVLPPAESRALSRELLYTAITRARERVIALGSQESLVAAIGRRAPRASGLGARLR